MSIYERPADLHKCPMPITFDHDYTHISIGDLHGNALKLIYTLIEEGVLELDEARYNILHDIYLKAYVERKQDPTTHDIIETCHLTQQDILQFKDIISNAKVNPTKSITLIGDELSDRGNNDYFTLLVLKKLKKSCCNVDIMMSNHSIGFMSASTITGFCGTDLATPCDSLENMRYILEKRFIEESEVREIVENVYTPMVKAIGYTISPDGQITLFSHAPIGLETVQTLAEKFNIPYKDDPPLELIKTIDAINCAISVAMNNIIKNRPNNDLMYAICTLMDAPPTPYDNAGLIQAIRLVIDDKQHALADKELIDAIRLIIDDPINKKPFLNSGLIDEIKEASYNFIGKNPNKDLVDLFIAEDACIATRERKQLAQNPIRADLPLYRLFWNRVFGNELRTITASGAQVYFVHGHIGPGEIKIPTIPGQDQNSHKNSDNNFGKDNTLCSTGSHPPGSHPYGKTTVDVRHFTDHSSDLTQKDLISLPNLQELDQFNIFNIKKISTGLQKKATTNPLYDAAAAAVATNLKHLTQAGEVFFSQPITAESLEKFKAETQTIYKTLETECKKHQNQTGIDVAVIKALDNVTKLASEISSDALSIPATIVHLITKGLAHTFAIPPNTNAACQPVVPVSDNVQKVQEMKAAVSALKTPDPNATPPANTASP